MSRMSVRKMVHGVVVLLLVICFADGEVVQLTDTTFNKVLSSNQIWFVKFHATWCGHCKRLAPEWVKAAEVFKGIINFAEVDAEQNTRLSQQYKVEGYPTVLAFGDDKEKPISLSGRTVQDIMKEGARILQQIVSERLGQFTETPGDDVVELTEDTFHQVLNSKEPWLVAFVAPWCGHCQHLEPEWNKAATRVKGMIKMGRVDATKYRQLAHTYDVHGYPTIKYYPADSKQHPLPYDGARSADGIVEWVHAHGADLLPTPKFEQIVNHKMFEAICQANAVCIIAVMPPLIDCQSECRNKYLAMVKDELSKFKSQRWGWGWISALDHPKLEYAMDVSESNYPALVALSIKKNHGARMFLSFVPENVHNFLNTIATGTGVQGMTLRSIPTLDTVEPWDGKDEPLIVDDDDVAPEPKTEL